MEISTTGKVQEKVLGVTTNGECRDKIGIFSWYQDQTVEMREKVKNCQKTPLPVTDFSVSEKRYKIMTNSYPLALQGTCYTLPEEKFRTKEFESKLVLLFGYKLQRGIEAELKNQQNISYKQWVSITRNISQMNVTELHKLRMDKCLDLYYT